MVGISQALPAKLPDTNGLELSKMRTVDTINLSATGSKKAPKGECVPYTQQQASGKTPNQDGHLTILDSTPLEACRLKGD